VGGRSATLGAMWVRWLALAAVVWTGAYVAAYLVLVGQDGNGPAWWYVGLIALGTVPLIAVVAGRSSRLALVASVVVLGLAALLGLLSIGIFLVPAVVCAIVAAIVVKTGHRVPAGG
jgi:peptidoglycan/LPS O-acetylase OafA/YrhL